MLLAIWDDEAVEHVAEHGLTPADVDHVLAHPDDRRISRSSGRPIIFGYTRDGRYIAVVYEAIDDLHVYPITAYEV